MVVSQRSEHVSELEVRWVDLITVTSAAHSGTVVPFGT